MALISAAWRLRLAMTECPDVIAYNGPRLHLRFQSIAEDKLQVKEI